MGKIHDETEQSERVQAARARLQELRRQQGVPLFSVERLKATTIKSDEPDQEIIAFLREIRSEGKLRDEA